MNVNIDTKFITLIGDPLRQSFAARMQNAGYEAAGLNMLYFYTEADNEHLGDIVKGLRYMNFAGFAVTKPNKIKVLEYLDELDPLCEKMGSSNTVVKTAEGKLVGYNTDGIGFYKSITEEGGIKADQCVFFCFGAGGAGRASPIISRRLQSPWWTTSTRTSLLLLNSWRRATFPRSLPATWS